METRKYRSFFFKNTPERSKAFSNVKGGVKFLAVGITALLALGLFTTSQRLNAG